MIYSFGSFVLDSRTGTLTGPDGPVPLRRQAFRLCEVLLASAPDLLEHDEILNRVWGRTALSPNVLPQTLSELRQALGDSPQSPRYIETVHRRGYRVICPVNRSEQAEAVPATPVAAAASAPRLMDPPVSSLPRPRRTAMFALLLATGLMMLGWAYVTWQKREKLYTEAIPQIRATVDSDVFDAWRQAREVLRDYPDEPGVRQLMRDLTIPFSLQSQPSEARVLVGPYDAQDGDWVNLGTTPIEDMRLPITMLRFHVSKPGHIDLDLAPGLLPLKEPFQLHESHDTPPGMVFIPGDQVTYMGETRRIDEFWIDRLEVSNRDYQEFVEAGGYDNPEFWTHPVTVDGRELDMEGISSFFVDRSGLPGPAFWTLGKFPNGEADHPVEGVSWFEAAAYAKYRGRALPTVFHWWRAAGRGGAREALFGNVVTASNFASDGSWPVGTGGLGPYGTRDMAGNVGEWCANASGESRHFLGGSWVSEPYGFLDMFAQPALNRNKGHGFRLMHTDSPVAGELLAALSPHSPRAATPIGDATFRIISRQYVYDDSPLNAQVETVDTSQRDWRRERITFDAAYRDERVILDLYIPAVAAPPYQTVVHFPGADALLVDSVANAGLLSIEPFLRTGRAVAFPVYQGTFERQARRRPGPLAIRQQLVEQVQDVSRTLDYLSSRGDIAQSKIAYHGLSYGAVRAPIILAIEKRFSTAMILSAGLLPYPLPPELTLENYLPRVTLPTLFVSGRDDFNHPYRTAQLPFFDLLGSPVEQKKHVVIEGGHLPTGYARLQRELITWLDETLGPSLRR